MASSKIAAKHQSGSDSAHRNGRNGEDATSAETVRFAENEECVQVERKKESAGMLGTISDMIYGEQKEKVTICTKKETPITWETYFPFIREYLAKIYDCFLDDKSDVGVKYGGEKVSMVFVPFKYFPADVFTFGTCSCHIRTWDWLFDSFGIKSPFETQIGFRTSSILNVHVYDIVGECLVPKESFNLNEVTTRFK